MDTTSPYAEPSFVVGIGASAGGIVMLRDLFGSIAADIGMAFVVVQHLPPGKPSELAKLIGRWTSLTVGAAVDGVRPEPNHVYVPSPDDIVTIEGGILRTRPVVDGDRRPGIDTIDAFFESLAEDRKSRAIGVILSGTGMDGTAGAATINRCGGIVMVQDPATALYADMPTAAIKRGVADHVLPVNEIGTHLCAFGNPSYKTPASIAAGYRDVTEALNHILDHIRKQCGFDLSGYKPSPLVWRIQQRLDRRKVQTFADYLALLEDDPAELEALIRGIPIHVTEFFRDPEAWGALGREALLPLLLTASPDRPIRVWTPACSTGQEAYSVAMLLTEIAEKNGLPANFQVFATDASPEVLAQAGRGAFSNHEMETVPAERKARFFYAVDDKWRIKRSLREKMVFATQDLVADPPFTGVDLVTCRNLLIYLAPDAAKRVLYLLHNSLRIDGFLFLGHGEPLSARQKGFRTVSAPMHIYRKVGPLSDIRIKFPTGPEKRRNAAAVAAHIHRASIEHFDYPSVLIDDHFNVLRVYGDTSKVLRLPEGRLTQNLMELAPQLTSDLVGAAGEALAFGRSVAVKDARDKDGVLGMTLQLTPLQTSDHDGMPRLLVSFIPPDVADEAGDGFAPAPQAMANSSDQREWSEAVRISRQELEASREELQALNEELKAANEQLNLSNEDLNQVNAQLHDRIAELEMQRRVLSSSNVTTLFLDGELRVRWFTPEMRDLFPLGAADAGRPITDLVPKFDDPTFLRDARAVMDGRQSRETEVRSTDGRWFLRRISPFLAAADAASGVAVKFTDITQLKNAQDAIDQEFRNTKILQELSARLVTEENVQAIYEAILAAAVEITRAAAGTVQLLDDEGRDLVILAAQGLSSRTLKYFHRVDASSTTSCGIALRSGQRSFLDFDPASRDFSDRTHVDDGVLSAQSTPLVTRSGKPIGMVSTHWAEIGRRPSEREMRFLDLLARQAADLIERTSNEEAIAEELRNARILQDLGARLVTEESVQAIYEAILTAALEITRAKFGTVQGFDAGTEELVVLATRGFSRRTEDYFRRLDASSNTSCGLALRAGARAFSDFDPASTDTSVRLHVEDGVFSAQSSPLISRSGKPIGMVSTHWTEAGHRPSERELRFLDLLVRQAADLIEQRQAEAGLRNGASRLRLASEAAELGVFEWDPSNDSVSWENDRMFEIFGRTREQGALTAAMFIANVVHPDDAERFKTTLEASLTSGKLRYTGRFYRADGALRWVMFSGKVEYAVDGTPLRMPGVTADITEREVAEAALRESKARYQALFAASPVPFMVLAPNPPDFTITAANEAYFAATQTSAESLIGRRLFDVFPDDPNRPGQLGSQALAISLDRVLRTRRTDAMKRVRYDLATPGGGFEPHWWLAINAPMLDAKGNVVAIIHQVDRQTELQMAEDAERLAQEALRESERRLRTLVSQLEEEANTALPNAAEGG